MIEELKDEELVRRVGGRFKLSALIQKRLVTLNKGSQSPVEFDRKNSTAAKDKLHLVIQEILQDKIHLKMSEAQQGRAEGNVDMVFDELSNL